MNERTPDEEGVPHTPRWLGPLGVLVGFILAFVLTFLLVPFLSSSPLPLLLFLAVPAVSGYAYRALSMRTTRAAISSFGTAIGWVLFFALSISALPVGGLAFALFIFPPPLRLLGWILLAMVALGFILVSQGLTSFAVRRFLPS